MLRVEPDEILAYLAPFEVAVRSVAARADTLPYANVGGRAPLRRIDSPEGALLVRPYRKGGLLRHVRGSWFRGRMRPLDELVLLRKLAAVAVPVTEAVGCAIARSPMGWQGHLLTREVGASLDLEAWLYGVRPAEAPSDRTVLLRAGRAVRALHEAGVEHADLHPKNLLLTPQGRVLILDLDAARQSDHPLRDDARLRNLARFARAVEKHRLKGQRVSARQGLRFLEGYAGDRTAGRLWRQRVVSRLQPTLGLRRLWWRLTGEARPWQAGVHRVAPRDDTPTLSPHIESSS